MIERVLFHDTPLPSPITEFTLQIATSLEGDDYYASGTAVIVAPYLAFSALHVLEDHWARHHSEPMPKYGENTGRFAFLLAQLVENELNLWTVTRLWSTGLSDIVLMRLGPVSEGAHKYKFKHLSLDLAPPRVGEQVLGFGFSESAVVVGPKSLSLEQRASTTYGTVVELFHERRDAIRMPFPCFRTNARFDGGMSGGPIFNQAGHLCGLICSTYPPSSAADEDHASYTASLWPAMATPIDMNRDGHPWGVWYRTFDLIENQILLAQNADLLVIDPLGDDPFIPPRIGFQVDIYDARAGTIQGQSAAASAVDDQKTSGFTE